MRKPLITYIVQASADSAVSENARRRTHAMEKAGYHVELHTYAGKDKLSASKLTNSLRHSSIVCIRVDGSGLLGTLTLRKIFMPNIRVVWEIHSWPKELYIHSRARAIFRVRAFHLKRLFLSLFADAYIFVSDDLKNYSTPLLAKKPSTVISNFIELPSRKSPSTLRTSRFFRHLFPAKHFVVLWGGSAQYPWHALDVIEKVARQIFQIDSSIRFILVGPRPWHTFHWHENIIFCDSLPPEVFDLFVARAEVCLTLYHESRFSPAYFSPLEMLAYMRAGKPTVATTTIAQHMKIVDGVDGFTTNNTVSDIVQKILYLKKHRAEANRMGLRAKTLVQRTRGIQQAILAYKTSFHTITT